MPADPNEADPSSHDDSTDLPITIQDRIIEILTGDVEGRSRALEQLCQDHAVHADRIREVFAAYELTAKGLPAANVGRGTDVSWVDDEIPDQIGGLRILKILGEGGMGTVYLAEQKEPVRRRVAVKVIKLGMDTKAVLQRFRLERQALAVMNHDNIARVYDAGTTDRGQPYFSMEHVPGTPFTKYCDVNKLPLEQRIRLFQQVCSGVQHAHQKGVIHRDLKPSNVLVTEEQGQPVPKIIDFGLARATDNMLLQATVFTEEGRVIGTPEYMAPEQVDPTVADIDTRADVYSLGVLLYELLVGALPFAKHELRQGGLAEMQRVIRDVEPKRPSTKLSSSSDISASVAEARRTTTTTLLRSLRTDLDWIVLMAIDKDRNRRYGSANELALDLERYLQHEPVLAGPPTPGYRFKKFVRRYRGQVGVAVILFAMMLTGIVGITTQWLRANQKAEVAETVATYLQELFMISDPFEAKGDQVLAREILDRGARRIESGLGMAPAVRSELMQLMGEVYFNLGLLPEACSLLESALGERRSLHGRRSLEVADTLHALGAVYFFSGRNTVAREAFDESLAIRRRRLAADDITLADSYQGLAGVCFRDGSFAKAEEYYSLALTIRQSSAKRSSEQVANLRQGLTLARLNQTPTEELLEGFEEALRIYEDTVGLRNPSAIDCLSNYGWWLNYFGRHVEAESRLLQALELNLVVREEKHPSLAACRSNLAVSLLAQARAEEARPHADAAVASLEASMPPGSSRLALAKNVKGAVLSALGHLGEAGRLLERSYVIIKGERNQADLRCAIQRMALHYTRTGEPDKAREFSALLEDSIDLVPTDEGRQDPDPRVR